MKTDWKMVRLGEVLRHRKAFVQIDDTASYKLCRVQTNAKGVVLRSVLTGADIKTKKQQVCRAGEFLVAEIDAKAGGYGLVPPELEGAIVSSHYFLYEIDAQRLDREYLGYYATTPQFARQIAVQGSTNYAALRPQEVLTYTIPLPPLSEQRRLVAHLHRVQAHVAAVQALRRQQEAEMGALLGAAFREATAAAPRRPLAEVAPITRRPVVVSETEEYPELGIRSFGRGTFHKPAVPGREVGTKKLFYVAPGDVLFSNVFAWEGAIAVVQPADEGRVGSHRFISCVCHPDVALPEFVAFYFLTPVGLEHINAASPGGAGRNKTLGLEKLEKLPVPVPPLAVQRQFVALQAHLTALRTAQAGTAGALGQVVASVLGEVFGG